MNVKPEPVFAEAMLVRATETWRRCATSLPPLGPRYTPDEQAVRESYLDRCLGAIDSELMRPLPTKADRTQAHARITAAFAEFARSALGLGDGHIAVLLQGGFPDIGTKLGRMARELDSGARTSEIFQACRNAWAACGLQALFGLPMAVTPAIFAYSMLYPYSDNYLDDADVAREQKLSFSGRFRRRLAGESLQAANAREETIWKLAGLIESGYPRSQYPDLYSSLLAIHRAQEQSLVLLQRGAVPARDVLAIVFTKGGTSVLTDAYLAAGHLTEDQATFAFDWGILLQLGDDLQDVREDSARGLRTILSDAAAEGRLEETTNRVFHFSIATMAGMEKLTKGPAELKDILRLSSISLLVRAAGELQDFYPAAYVAELEAYSPFRFAFLKTRREQLARHRGRMAKTFDAFLTGEGDEPVFPMLPSSLFMR